MRVTVGSTNATKVEAVRTILADYPLFAGAAVEGVSVSVEEFGHPKNLNEIVSGARERARQAFVDADYSFGIEGGLMAVPGTKTGYMEVAACAIFDGLNYYLGLSPGYEWPRAVLDGILHHGLDGSQALRAAGITTEEKIGASRGGIAILTCDRINRTLYNKLAIQMALIQLEFPEHYR